MTTGGTATHQARIVRHAVSVERCEECAFVYGDLPTGDVPRALRALGAEYVDVLSRSEVRGLVDRRPEPEVRSALEYACHVRDVLLIQRDRVLLALVEDTPGYSRMYRDERVTLAGYRVETVEEVANEVAMAANLMAKVLEGLSPVQLQRRCIYNFPEPTRRDVAWLARHTVHEVSHHLGGVRSVLEQVAA